MFESVLQKILEKYMGEFISGFDKQNMKAGIWSGKIIIENVRLKEEVIKLLNLPLKLRFSHIGKLTVIAPWNNLSSSPVEIQLDGVYVIVSQSTEWQNEGFQFDDFKELKIKQEQIEKYAQECIQKIVDKQTQKKEDNGYITKLTMRIIDNIQLSIKSIHIRYEDMRRKEFSFGCCLNQLDINTVDQNGQRCFVDRTKPERKDDPMRKVVQLQNLGIYWNQRENDNNFLSSKNNTVEIISMMDNMIERADAKKSNCNYLFSITSNVHLVQEKKGSKKGDPPEIDMDFELDIINFSLDQLQLQQQIKLVEFIADYNQKLQVQKLQNLKKFDEKTVKGFKQTFYDTFIKLQTLPENETLDMQEQKDYEQSIMYTDIEVLLEKTRKAVIKVQKDKDLKKEAEKKYKAKQGWTGGWFSKSKQEDKDSLITEEDKQKFDKFYAENFSEDKLDIQVVCEPEYVWFTFKFNFKGLNLNLLKFEEMQNIESGIIFSVQNFSGKIDMRDKQQKIQSTLAVFSIEMCDKQSGKITKKSVVKPIDIPSIQSDVEINPLYKPNINKIVKVKIGQSQIDYSPIFLNRLSSFFDVQVENQELKDKTREAYENKIEETQQNLSNKMSTISDTIMIVDIQLKSPVIIIPFLPQQSIEDEIWEVRLGDLYIKTDPRLEKDNLPDEIKALDLFNIRLENMSMFYYESHLVYNQKQLVHSKRLIQDFYLDIQIEFLKDSYKKAYPEKPLTNVIAKMSDVPIDMDTKIYAKLVNIGQAFALPESEQSQQKNNVTLSADDYEVDKQKLIDKAIKISKLSKKNQNNKFIDYYAILEGGYIYFFENPKALIYKEKVWIKNSNIQEIDQKLFNLKNVFRVTNKTNDNYFSCKDDKHAKDWIHQIDKIRHVVQNFDGLLEEANKTQQKEQEINYQQKQIQAKFQIVALTLNIIEDNNILFTLQTKNLNGTYESYEKRFNAHIQMGGLFLQDYIYEYQDKTLLYLITSDLEDSQEKKQNNQLISIIINQVDKQHPEYKNLDQEVTCDFQSLRVNYKPNSMIKLMSILQQNDTQKSELKQVTPKIESQESITTTDSRSQIVNNQIISLIANIKISKIEVIMVNNMNNLKLGKLSLEQMSMKMTQKVQEMHLIGGISNFRLIDFSNYPNTLLREEDFHKINPYELLGRERETKDKLITIDYTQYYEGSDKIIDDTNAIVDLQMNHLKINYQAQSIMRIVSFITSQMTPSLSGKLEYLDHDQLEQNLRFKDSLIEEGKEVEEFAQFAGLTKEQIFAQVRNPPFMKMNINISNSVINLKPNPKASDYLIMKFDNINIQNYRIYNSDRIIGNVENVVDHVYGENYRILIQNIYMQQMVNQMSTELIRPFDFNLSVIMPQFQQHYMYLFSNKLYLDNIMYVQMLISPIVLTMSNKDYNLIMKCLNHNVSYNDGNDQFLNFDFWKLIQDQVATQRQANQSQKKNEVGLWHKFTKEKLIDNKGGIDCKIDIQNLTIFATKQNHLKEYLPYGRVSLIGTRIKYHKELDEVAQIGLTSISLTGSYFDFEEESGKYRERVLLGGLNVDYLYEKQNMKDSWFLLQKIEENEKNDLSNNQPKIQLIDDDVKKVSLFQFQNYPTTDKTIQQSENLQLIFEMTQRPTGFKKISVQVSDLRLNLQIGTLLQLSALSTLEQETNAPEPMYPLINIDKYVSKDNIGSPALQEETFITVDVKNILIYAMVPQQKFMLTIRGALNLEMESRQSMTLDQYQEKLSKFEGLKPDESFNCIQKMVLNTDGLELFICDIEEMKKQDFRKAKKRQILHPTNIALKSLTNHVSNEQQDNFDVNKNMQIKVNNTIFKITFKDVMLLQQIYADVMQQLEQKEIIEEKQENAEQLSEQSKQSRQSISHKDKLSKIITQMKEKQKELKTDQIIKSLMEIDLIGLSIVCINDSFNTYSPILDFKIYNSHLIINTDNLFSKTAFLPLIFKANYYNPRQSCWEPFIEEVALDVNIIDNPHGTTKKLIAIENSIDVDKKNRKLDFNISTQFIEVLFRTLDSYNKTFVNTTKKEEKIQRKSYAVAVNTNQILANAFKSLSRQKIQKKDSIEEQIDEQHNVSPYQVYNKTGCDIQIFVDNQIQPLRVKDMQKQGVQINLKEYYTDQQSEQHKVKIQINDKNRNFEPIEDVMLDRLRSRRRMLVDTNGKTDLILNTQVILDDQTMTKLLVLQSNIEIVNLCQDTIGVEMKLDGLQSFVQLQNTIKYAIPINLTKAVFKLIYKNQQSDFYDFPNLLKDFEKTKTMQIKFNSIYLCLNISLESMNLNKFILKFQPVYSFKNCIPKELELQIVQEDYITYTALQLKEGEQVEFFQNSMNEKLRIITRIPGYYWSEMVYLNKDIQQMQFKDSNLANSNIQVMCSSPDQNIEDPGYKIYYFYCSALILNYTNYDLCVYTRQSENSMPMKVGGQEDIQEDIKDERKDLIILGANKEEQYLSLKDNKTELANLIELYQTNIVGVGTTEIDLTTHNQQNELITITLACDIKLQKVDNQVQIFSKIIKISPKFIVINQIELPIQVTQHQMDQNLIGINFNERKEFFWTQNRQKERFINVLIPGYERSGAIDISTIGLLNTWVKNLNKQEQHMFLNIEISQIDANIYVNIIKLQNEHRPYKIENHSDFISIQLNDITIHPAKKEMIPTQNEDDQFVYTPNEYYFSWDNPQDKKEIKLEFLTEENYISFNETIIPDKVMFSKKLKVKHKEKKAENERYVKYQILIDEYTKIIKIENSYKQEVVTLKEQQDYKKKLLKQQKKREKQNQKQGLIQVDEVIEDECASQSNVAAIQINQPKIQQSDGSASGSQSQSKSSQSGNTQTSIAEQNKVQIIQNQICVKIDKLGISLIDNVDNKQETLYIYFEELEFGQYEYIQSKVIQCKISYLNIDNNSEYFVKHPVVFTPSEYKKYHLEEKDKKPGQDYSFINILIEKNLNAKSITLYDRLVFQIEPITLKIESSFISTITNFVQKIQEQKTKGEVSFEESSTIIDNRNRYQIKNDDGKFFWQICEIGVNDLPTYIDQFILSPLHINLSFNERSGDKNLHSHNDLAFINSISQALGSTLKQIDDAPIKFNGMKFEHSFDTIQGIQNKLMQHYKQQAIFQVLKSLGSLNIIGNPVGLFGNISTGVNDLIDKPLEGFAQGPLEGGMGLALGAGSLVKNTLSGTFNSVSKITGSISTGVTNLCFDDEYIKKREKQREEKAKHIGQGLEKAGKSVLTGFADGISGVFLKPIQGGQKEGLIGVGKGIFTGVAGLIIKPIDGIIGGVSSVAEGVTNNLKYWDDKPNQHRIRPPRVFYGLDQTYQEYDVIDAEMVNTLQVIKKGRYANSQYFCTFFNEVDGHKHFMIILFDAVIYLSEKKGKTDWYYAQNNFQSLQKKEKSVIQLKFSQPLKSNKKKQIDLKCMSEQLADEIRDKIIQVRKIIDEEAIDFLKDQVLNQN